MSNPQSGSPLFLYLDANHFTVSAALVQERKVAKEDNGTIKETHEQFLVYFVSEALGGSKLFPSEMEKIAYAIVMATRKLRHYFESHSVKVRINQPLNDVFRNRNASGRIGK